MRDIWMSRARARILAGASFLAALGAALLPIALFWGADWKTRGDVAVDDPFHLIPIGAMTIVTVPSLLAAWGLMALGRRLAREDTRGVGWLGVVGAILLFVALAKLSVKDGVVPSILPGSLPLLIGAVLVGLVGSVIAEDGLSADERKPRSASFVFGVSIGMTAICVMVVLLLAGRILAP